MLGKPVMKIIWYCSWTIRAIDIVYFLYYPVFMLRERKENKYMQ